MHCRLHSPLPFVVLSLAGCRAESPSAVGGERVASSGPSSFVSFELTADEDPCPPLAEGDCRGRVSLSGDGSLQMDPWGHPDSPLLASRVSGEARRPVLDALAEPGFLELLRQRRVCPEANATEHVRLRFADAEYENDTGFCNQEPIQRLRGELLELTRVAFPDHSWFSPPFAR